MSKQSAHGKSIDGLKERGLHFVQIRIPEGDWLKLRSLAGSRGLSATALVLRLIEEEFERSAGKGIEAVYGINAVHVNR